MNGTDRQRITSQRAEALQREAKSAAPRIAALIRPAKKN